MFTIRPATPADADVICHYNLALALETEDLQLDKETLAAGVLAVQLDPSKGRYFLAEAADGCGVIGQCMTTYEWSDWRNAQVWWVQSVFVAPTHRRRGVYRALYEHVREAAKRAGACGVRLYVDNANARGQAAYTRLGMSTHYSVYEDMW